MPTYIPLASINIIIMPRLNLINNITSKKKKEKEHKKTDLVVCQLLCALLDLAQQLVHPPHLQETRTVTADLRFVKKFTRPNFWAKKFTH